MQVDRDVVALQHDHQFGVLRPAVGDEVRRPAQGNGQHRRLRRRLADHWRRPGSSRDCVANVCSGARFLQRRQPRRQLRRQADLDLGDVRLGPLRRARVGHRRVEARAVRSASCAPLVETANLGLNANAAQSVTWKGTSSDAAAPSALVRAPVIFSGLQSVGLNVKPGRLIVTLTCLICSGMPSMIVGILVCARVVGRDRQRRRQRVHFDLRAHHDRPAFLQVERAGLRGVDDRQTERGPLVRAGDVHLAAGDVERVAADADADDRFPDQAFRTTRTGVGLRFPAQFYARQQARQARWHVQLDALQVLLAVFTAERRRKRREPARLQVGRAGVQRRGERERTLARRPARAGGDLEFGADGTAALPDHGVNDASVS